MDNLENNKIKQNELIANGGGNLLVEGSENEVKGKVEEVSSRLRTIAQRNGYFSKIGCKYGILDDTLQIIDEKIKSGENYAEIKSFLAKHWQVDFSEVNEVLQEMIDYGSKIDGRRMTTWEELDVHLSKMLHGTATLLNSNKRGWDEKTKKYYYGYDGD